MNHYFFSSDIAINELCSDAMVGGSVINLDSYLFAIANSILPVKLILNPLVVYGITGKKLEHLIEDFYNKDLNAFTTAVIKLVNPDNLLPIQQNTFWKDLVDASPRHMRQQNLNSYKSKSVDELVEELLELL